MLQICKYGNPILRVKAAPVGGLDQAVIKLAGGMLDLMAQKKGVGLAAQQVGATRRIFVMHVPPQYDLAAGQRLNPEINEPLVMLNPEVLSRQGAGSQDEGCLSIPDLFAPVRRAVEISVAFLDLQGQARRLVLKGFMARVFQHELDHLNGILFVDRLAMLKKIALAAQLKHLKRLAEREAAAH